MEVAGRSYDVGVCDCSAALAGLLSSVTPTTPLPPSTPHLTDLNGLFNTASQSVGHQLLAANPARDSSPITAVAAAAAAGLLAGPPACMQYCMFIIVHKC